MKIKLEESDLKTLKEENGIYSYSIKTKIGNVKCSEIDSVEAALKHCEEHLKKIIKSILSK